MKYYQYDKNSLEYTNEVEVKEGREPANAIMKKIPNFYSKNEHCVFDLVSKKWNVISKKEFVEMQIGLGQKDKLSDREKLNEVGEKISKTRLELIEENLITKDQVLEQKLFQISSLAKEKIESGFESKAKGQFYIYDSELEDQFNIQSLLLAGKDTPLRCRKKSDGIKDFYPHTTSQIKQIVDEFSNFKTAILKKAHEYKIDLEAKSAIEIENTEIIY